jgi:hypothetical protein
MRKEKPTSRLTVSLICVVLFSLASLASVARADVAAPWWGLSSTTYPSVLPESGNGTIAALVENLGDTATSGEIVFTDKLPAGVTVQGPVSLFPNGNGGDAGDSSDVGRFLCSPKPGEASAEVTCKFFGGLNPYETLEIRIPVELESVSLGARTALSVSGGGALPVSIEHPLRTGAGPESFGVESYAMIPEAEGGGVETQAGSHPFQLSTTFAFDQSANAAAPPALLKDVRSVLPAGLIGNPTPFPQCAQVDFASILTGFTDACPNATAIGVVAVTTDEPVNLGLQTGVVPLFNLKPSPGEPARFGFELDGTLNVLDVSAGPGDGYKVVVEDRNIPETVNVLAARVIFWGVPGDPAHDSARGWSCIKGELYTSDILERLGPCRPLEQQLPPPLLTLPASCSGALQTTVQAYSWSEPGNFTPALGGGGEPAMDGCNRLPFSASISVAPDGQAASTPSGLSVSVHVPQQEALNSEGLSPAEVRNTTVALPAGVTLNPAAADGLQACGDLPEVGRPEGQIGLNNSEEVACPEASKVATLEIKTPLLPNPLVGEAYLAAQDQNPFGSLVALYLVARDPVSGVLVKLAGEVKPDPVTGQLVSTFKETPQLPFEDLTLHFFGGDRAPLSTPSLCGAYTTQATIEPWSGNEAVTPSSTFDIASGPNGSACSSPLPFAPTLTGGTSSVQAGGFSPFLTTFSRPDGSQDLQGIQLHMPPGLLGLVSSVSPCGEAQANAGTCAQSSLIGHTIVSVGVGGDPYTVKGGEVFLTGPYEGAPYGLSIVNPAKAGPFDLGKVVVRAKIEVDPLSANLTVTTDPSGPYSIPHILDGIPLQIQHVSVSIDRPGFIFNPTDCDPLALSGSITSDQGASSSLDVPFQVTDCASLGFKPKLTVTTSGKASRKNGTSLAIKIAYPKSPIGKEAWFRSAKFAFPKQLPARLTTLQKACPSATFDANPAACSPGSHVGTAIVHTPVLPDALRGVVYFVSYGGAKFPEAVIVLQGDNVTVDLHAETFIDGKTGITSATLRSIPGVPFENVEVVLPAGPDSEFAANGNLCTNKPKMSTAFTAQNALVVHQTTALTVTGCTKHKTNAKAHKQAKAKHKKKK